MLPFSFLELLTELNGNLPCAGSTPEPEEAQALHGEYGEFDGLQPRIPSLEQVLGEALAGSGPPASDRIAFAEPRSRANLHDAEAGPRFDGDLDGGKVRLGLAKLPQTLHR